MEKKIERRLRCFNCGRWNVWDKPLHPDCLCGDAQYTSKALSNQPIEEKWKEEFEKFIRHPITQKKNEPRMFFSVILADDVKSFIENLLEQERNHYEKELKIADERWKRAEANHREKHESETEICVYH